METTGALADGRAITPSPGCDEVSLPASTAQGSAPNTTNSAPAPCLPALLGAPSAAQPLPCQRFLFSWWVFLMWMEFWQKAANSNLWRLLCAQTRGMGWRQLPTCYLWLTRVGGEERLWAPSSPKPVGWLRMVTIMMLSTSREDQKNVVGAIWDTFPHPPLCTYTHSA